MIAWLLTAGVFVVLWFLWASLGALFDLIANWQRDPLRDEGE